MYLKFLIVCLICVSGQNFLNKHRPLVRLPQGGVSGIKVYGDSRRFVDAYLGVPYAAPPVGNLRFAPPQKHLGWNSTLNASDFGNPCPQLVLNTNKEDCLFLNIWTPENAHRFGNYPVVVFFEGRDYASSNPFPITGQELASEGVIVVTVNYRLNVFGFLCLGTSRVRGNFGLLDQYFALLWVRENIRLFGGDPEKITLFGFLSGGTSVTFHMVSPRTAGLFQRAIISSGSAVSPWQKTNDPVRASKEIIRILGCDSYTPNTLVCLRSKSVEQILRAYEEYTELSIWSDKFLPVTDDFLPEHDQYLPKDTGQALKDGTYLQVPILTGLTKPTPNPQYAQWVELASQGYSQLLHYIEKAKIPEIMKMYNFNGANKEQIYDLIRWQYVSPGLNEVHLLFEQINSLEYDAKIEAPHYLQLQHLVMSYVQPIFAYYLDDIKLTTNGSDFPVTSDLILLFGPLLLRHMGRHRFNSNEIRLSKYIRQLWTNFIIFGNPTPNNRAKIWRKYTSDDNYVENLITDLSNTGENVKRIKRVSFWTQLLPKIANMQGAISNNIPKELQNSPDPAAGFRHAMYTLVGLVVALLILLLICILLLKKRAKERERHLHMGY